jgi:hypothetical protein
MASNSSEQKRLVREALAIFQSSFNRPPRSSGVDFLIGTGDAIYEAGTTNELDMRWHRNLDAVYSDCSFVPAICNKVMLQILGNHDQSAHGIFRDTSGFVRRTLVAPHRNFWAPSTYFAQRFVHADDPKLSLLVAVINPYEVSGHLTKMRAAQLRWLESMLSRHSDARHKVVVGHRPIFSAGSKHGSSKYMQDKLMPLFRRYNVSLYLCGDDHSLQLLRESGDDTLFVVSGGGARLEALKRAGVKQTLFQAHSLGFVSVEWTPANLRLAFYDNKAELLRSHKVPE